MLKWWMLPRVRRGLAVSAIVLSAGGLILHRAPSAHARTPSTLVVNDVNDDGSFKGPRAHGNISLAQTRVLAGKPERIFAEIHLDADAVEGDKERAPVSLAVVLDTSGSMSGEKIAQAKSAVLRLISTMRDDDQIAFIRYSDTHDIVQPLARAR